MYWGNDELGECESCQIPCYECSGGSNICTSCFPLFFLSEDVCLMTYPFPFLITSVIITMVVLVIRIRRKETRFRETVIALIAWPELGCWLTALVFFASSTPSLLLALIALAVHAALNVFHKR